MAVDQDSLRRKNEELLQALREKSRKQLQTQELYDKLKRRAMLGQVQNAAGDAADHTIQASVAANRLVERVGNPGQQNIHPPRLSNMQPTLQRPNLVTSSNIAPPNSTGRAGDGANWAGFSSQNSTNNAPRKISILIWTQLSYLLSL